MQATWGRRFSLSSATVVIIVTVAQSSPELHHLVWEAQHERFADPANAHSRGARLCARLSSSLTLKGNEGRAGSAWGPPERYTAQAGHPGLCSAGTCQA
jgi:hypothetical protein